MVLLELIFIITEILPSIHSSVTHIQCISLIKLLSSILNHVAKKLFLIYK
jgi:hypothetical protein